MTDGVVQYKFLSLVGEGGFGKVYRARMQLGGFSKDVAIKLLSDASPPPSLLERFRDEANILGLIRDRAIVRVEPPVQISGRWAVVMEFVDGVSCGLMLTRGRLPAGVAVEIVGEVARALHAAYHQEGPEGEPLQLLHRDVKPENIQITPSGDVRLLDFGIAKANFAAREFKTRHSLGGTPGYIAPERLNRVEVPEGDVFSLGVVLHELVTGDRPRHPPTVEVDTQLQLDSVDDEVPFSGIQVDEEDLEIPDDLREDPLVMGVLRLAAWMRAYDPGTRPSSREVEEACRQFRQKLPPPFFRNWAETHVPHRMELDADDMVGQVLLTSRGTHAPLVVGRPITAPGTSNAGSNTSGMAFGALLGGGVTLLGVLGVGALIIAVIVVIASSSREPAEVTVGGTPPVVEPSDARVPSLADANPPDAPGTADDPPDPPAADEAPAEVEEPSRDVPTPRPVAPSKPVERARVEPSPPPVITLSPGPSAPSQPVAVDTLPVRQRPTGKLIVKTVPSNAKVYESGEELQRVGNGYVLEIGSHKVRVVSKDGESYEFGFKLSSNQMVTLCYNFDTNSRCGAPATSGQPN